MIEIKVSEIQSVWGALSDLVNVCDQPFQGQARRVLFKLQPEIKYLQQHPDDFEAIKDHTIQLGDKIAPPDSYPDEYKGILEKICESVPDKTSQIEQMISENGLKKVEE